MSIVRADALHLPLRDASIDLVVTSPPYFALRSYQDGDEHYAGQVGAEATPQEFLEALWAATAEMVRVLKPTGSIFVNLGDKYAGSGGHNNAGISAKSTLTGTGHHGGGARGGSQNKIKATRRSAPDRYNQSAEIGRRLDKDGQRYVRGEVPKKSLMGLPWRYAIGCVDQLGLILRRDLIWSKPNGLPESVTDRCRSSHEYWFHLTKEGRYFSAIDEIRLPYNGDRDLSRRVKLPGAGKHDQRAPWSEPHPLGALPGSVWTIPTEPLSIPDAVRDHYGLPDHYAAFPSEFPRRIILGWSPPGGTVLDPFGGTGTVAMVARALGRVAVNVDLSADYCRLARWRIYRSGHAAKAEDRTWRDGQGAML